MSNLGQALTAIAGGVIGFFASGFNPTGALYGFELGLLAGQIVSPTRLPGQFGPRITDGNTTTATVGGAVSFGYGYFAVAGTVTYLGACLEHSSTTSSSSKGAPSQSQTTYSYTQSIAIGLCEGPITDVLRIWENGQLMYDKRVQQPGETLQAYEARITANETYQATFLLYLGNESQEPDATMEADQGVGNVPAFRGLAYLMYPDRALRDDQGQRHPTWKVEVFVQLHGYEDTDDADLETIINLICAKCGYDTANQIDASSLSDVTVRGYAVQAVMAGRDALTPLRSVGLFDCVESGPKLKFVTRGGEPLRTLTTTDIGVYDTSSSANTDPDAAITVVEQQDVELPAQIRVAYLSTDNEYQAGQQLSPTRYDTEAVNIVDVQLAVCISDNTAVQLAEILWADAWQGRDTYTTSVDQSNADIEPSDVLLIPMLDSNFRMRVDKINDSSQIMRVLSLISDDDGVYVSTAVAPVSALPVQTMSNSSGSVFLPLDIPLLQDTDNDAGFYSVAFGDGTGNRWTGSVIYRSFDNDTFTQKASISGSPPIGNINSNLGAGITTTWDDENYIDITMMKGTFESRTDDSVIAGANTIAIGADGRWEVLQFGTAEVLEETTGTFTRLSHLLRGRRGTEWAVGTGLAGDLIIGLTMGNLFRIPMQTSDIGLLEYYKAVSIGLSYSSGTDSSFTDHAIALKPFAGCFLRGAMSGSDLVISWIRRDRIGQTLASGIETLMSEASESYSIDIMSGTSPETVKRTLTSSTSTVTYHAADIVTDFGTPPSEFDVRVYQLSAVVGRGYPLEGTVP